MAEIELPSSPPIVASLVDACASAGARIAEPGEFTFRAYVNGRLDLAQAESILSVIHARSDDELEAALGALEGEFSRVVRTIEDGVLDLCALVEAGIDFVDQDIEIIAGSQIRRELDRLIAELDRLLSQARTRETVSDRLTVLLYGPANSGKSTLFNRLVPGADAVVSDVPGTTRDVVFGETRLPGLEAPVRFADSAGILEAPGSLDAEAMRHTHEFLKTADLVLLLIDATRPRASEPLESRLSSRPHLIVTNKIDLVETAGPLGISAKTGHGLDALRQAIAQTLQRSLHGGADARFAVSARQRSALNAARYWLHQSRDGAAPGPEFVAVDLREAANELGSVSGRNVSEEILGRIFSRFCIGK
jgi:tRNA modification GTPase